MKMPPVLCCIVFLFVSMLSAVARQQEKPRVIVTTDGEIDDQSSMIRFLMYSSDYDVAGIVQVNGVQKDGHSKDNLAFDTAFAHSAAEYFCLICHKALAWVLAPPHAKI